MGLLFAPTGQVSPLAGIKATQVSRSAYTETSGAIFPISYNAVNQSATTTYAGIKAQGSLTPQLSVGASIGVEQDLHSSMDNYSGSIYYLGPFSQMAPAIQKTRGFAAANANYRIEKNQRVGFGIYYNQQSFNAANSATAIFNYTVGL